MTAAGPGRTRVGISGWSYDWPRFYPAGLPKKRTLEYAARRMSSIELNGSFYSLQRPSSYRDWRERTPRGFVFAVKGSRFITHNKKLADVEAPLANFLASGLLELREKLGPILWQVPPGLRFDAGRVERFFALLPKDTEAAAALARGHDARVAGRAATATDRRRPLRHAIEVRHPSWFSDELVDLARTHGIAIAFADSGKWPYVEEPTARFVYVRLHGSPITYVSDYGPRLAWWAERIGAWSAGSEPVDARRITDRPAPRAARRDAYVYFDNDARGHAPENAIALAARLGVAWDRGADAALAAARPPARR